MRFFESPTSNLRNAIPTQYWRLFNEFLYSTNIPTLQKKRTYHKKNEFIIFSLFPLVDCVCNANENLITWYACYTICDHYYFSSTFSRLKFWTSDKNTSLTNHFFSCRIFVLFRIQIHFLFSLLNFKFSFSLALALCWTVFPFSNLHSFHPLNSSKRNAHRTIASLEIQVLLRRFRV